MTRAFQSAGFDSTVAYRIWSAKYRWHGDHASEAGIEDTWHRVAAAVAAAENTDRDLWHNAFRALLGGFRFVPGGRILAGAGTTKRATLMNCFVMGTVEDSIDGIFDALKEGAITLQHGGGVGYDFSTLRPRGSPAAGTHGQASGPVSFLGLWDQCCSTLLSTSARRGAMMAVLRCDHP
ncbi:MAG: ribonucleotide reductase N-terminal alpha domain-containing protein, partial [Gammaproteobacteria bacterium]